MQNGGEALIYIITARRRLLVKIPFSELGRFALFGMYILADALQNLISAHATSNPKSNTFLVYFDPIIHHSARNYKFTFHTFLLPCTLHSIGFGLAIYIWYPCLCLICLPLYNRRFPTTPRMSLKGHLITNQCNDHDIVPKTQSHMFYLPQ